MLGIILFQTLYSTTIIPDKKKRDLHLPQVTLAMHQTGVYYSGIEIFNGLPKAIKTYLQQALISLKFLSSTFCAHTLIL
jgi:hypothetical protein